jgi:hypothetical protein
LRGKGGNGGGNEGGNTKKEDLGISYYHILTFSYIFVTRFHRILVCILRVKNLSGCLFCVITGSDADFVLDSQ